MLSPVIGHLSSLDRLLIVSHGYTAILAHYCLQYVRRHRQLYLCTNYDGLAKQD